MEKCIIRYSSVILTVVLFSLTFCCAFAGAADLQQSQRSGTELNASFQYLLSNFSGPVPSQWARVDFDAQSQETYTLTQGFNEVRIYNQQGMEIYSFGGDGEIVAAVDIASGDDGDIYILARDFRTHGIQRLNYRGQPQTTIHLRNLPQHLTGFTPSRVEYQDGLFYLLASQQLQIVCAEKDGTFKKAYDLAEKFAELAEQLDPEKKKALVVDINGFSASEGGQLYFTVPTLFSAFRLAPDGTLKAFGTSGSGPGKFGVVSGITADNQGNIYVADRLRSVVMIFDAEFIFLGEFGYRGGRPEDMIVPDDLVYDQRENRVFVSQAANKGVGVYRVMVSTSN